jgi:sec-independent protein translocase protein TatC
LGAVVAASLEHRLIDAFLEPSHGQQFIYTTPMGGVDFLFKVGINVGLIISIPVIVYQVLKFIEPLLRHNSQRFIFRISVVSGLLALVGLAFGYFVGLPNALHFLLNTFQSAQIKPLVTIQSYMSFVMMYMISSAMLLQLPLMLLFINRIKPLKPATLIKHQNWAVLGAFIGAFIINPPPNLIAQTIVAVPVVLSYYFGIAMIWVINRPPHRSGRIMKLIEQDIAQQQERLRVAESSIRLVYAQSVPATVSQEVVAESVEIPSASAETTTVPVVKSNESSESTEAAAAQSSPRPTRPIPARQYTVPRRIIA